MQISTKTGVVQAMMSSFLTFEKMIEPKNMAPQLAALRKFYFWSMLIRPAMIRRVHFNAKWSATFPYAALPG